MTLHSGCYTASRRDSRQGRPRSRGCESSHARPAEIAGIQSTEARFQPLATLPDSAPPSYRRRWERLATQAASSYRAATELMCLSCSNWRRREVKRCSIQTCPLFSVARRIFGTEEQP
jgi:hypothetical protein